MSSEKIIAPTDLRDFLKSAGWTLVEEGLRDRLYAFRNGAFQRRQLVFPMDLTAPDYAESVANVLEKLAGLTGQKVTALRAQADCFKDDVVRVRVHADGSIDQSLPLSFAASLVENTEKMLRAAACTVLRPRVHHPRLTLHEAMQLVEKARFGHTEAGSYVLRVACPINAIDAQGPLEIAGAQDPFVRRVTTSLQRALSGLTDAIETDRLDALVEEQKASSSPLLSSNLCEAVSLMHDDMIDNSLELSFDWSALQPVQAELRRPVRIQRDYFSRIEEVRRELRAVEQREMANFVGTVEGLDGDINADGLRSGEVVLSLLLRDEGETVRAKTMLSAQDYAKADQAHMINGAYVRVSGYLQPGRQPRQLTNVSHFEVILPTQERS
ncbi:hypothetical protein [Nannocystis sp. SCPEA4]|uniref:hypothetical protein n=1 Tax=Nannocystis sp. SCPEA4 TaxID=2996787 RepID=UPI0022718A6B|nr:hypothetical protein [Nannocystis sp. SCPEA4]MCY1060663.1 hypothetical protein [Nannocystis sp. SCPEA4]